ncbi:hypothetical protein [Telmatospirillum sp.]|uniref:hypothetical protein n=1 Tax=Telmatospirillum sp. TaxID=2079197 RepID=UPI00284FAAC8|nr:hypothetical protein [Telmatospirillum sp.]MDR3436039.1 hypothetical protein [Telmatospirillum sp.]
MGTLKLPIESEAKALRKLTKSSATVNKGNTPKASKLHKNEACQQWLDEAERLRADMENADRETKEKSYYALAAHLDEMKPGVKKDKRVFLHHRLDVACRKNKNLDRPEFPKTKKRLSDTIGNFCKEVSSERSAINHLKTLYQKNIRSITLTRTSTFSSVDEYLIALGAHIREAEWMIRCLCPTNIAGDRQELPQKKHCSITDKISETIGRRLSGRDKISLTQNSEQLRYPIPIPIPVTIGGAVHNPTRMVLASGLFRLSFDGFCTETQAEHRFLELTQIPADVSSIGSEVHVRFHRRTPLIVQVAADFSRRPIFIPWQHGLRRLRVSA